MIITFGNTKGGTGKSTLSINLTIRLAKERKVLLVDGDEQRSAMNFTELRKGIDYTCVSLQGSSLRTQVNRLKTDFETIVIDVGGRDTGSFRAALTLTDILIIPVQPRTFDVWAIADVAKLVDEAIAINPKLSAYALLNLADVQGKENDAAKEVLREYSMTLIETPIMRRKVYATGISQGKGIFEVKPMDKKAISEFHQALSFIYPKDSQSL